MPIPHSPGRPSRDTFFGLWGWACLWLLFSWPLGTPLSFYLCPRCAPFVYSCAFVPNHVFTASNSFLHLFLIACVHLRLLLSSPVSASIIHPFTCPFFLPWSSCALHPHSMVLRGPFSWLSFHWFMYLLVSNSFVHASMHYCLFTCS